MFYIFILYQLACYLFEIQLFDKYIIIIFIYISNHSFILCYILLFFFFIFKRHIFIHVLFFFWQFLFMYHWILCLFEYFLNFSRFHVIAKNIFSKAWVHLCIHIEIFGSNMGALTIFLGGEEEDVEKSSKWGSNNDSMDETNEGVRGKDFMW